MKSTLGHALICDDGEVTPRIHDSEPNLSEEAVRLLLEGHLPAWADLPISYVSSSGTSNALFRIAIDDGPDAALRLPRTAGASRSIELEAALLPQLARTDLSHRVRVPTLMHHGEPNDNFPFHWAALEWIDGVDLWDPASATDQMQLASDVFQLTRDLSQIGDMPVPDRRHGERGGPIDGVLESLDRWLTEPAWRASDLVDVCAIRRLADEAAEVAGQPYESGFVHGDLLPGNILADVRGMSALIDWGAAGYGDIAQDLAAAWALFDRVPRDAFREAAEKDEATWLRARTNELEHSVGAILYYRPRGHALADVMERTLNRILSEG